MEDKNNLIVQELIDLEDHNSPSFEGKILAIDSEWTSNNIPISLQFFIPSINVKGIVLNEDLRSLNPQLFSQTEISYKNNRVVVNVAYTFSFGNTNFSPLVYALEKLYKKRDEAVPKKFLLLLYYSPKDLLHAFGLDLMEQAFLNGKNRQNVRSWVDQNRCLNGLIYIKGTKYKLFDLYGFFDGGSFQKCALSVGIHLQSKNLMDAYKNNMEDAFFHPTKIVRKNYLRYAMEDCLILYQIWSSRIEQHNRMLREALNFPDSLLISPNQFPSTIGRLVSDTFQNFITYYVSKDVPIDTFNKALYRVGYLNSHHKNYNENLKLRKEIFSQNSTTPSQQVNLHCNRRVYSFSAISLSSIPYILSFDKKELTSLGSIVTGGRTVNERSEEIFANNLLDIDIGGSYATALESLEFPIGKPQIYRKQVNSFGLTLGEFLKKNKTNLIPGLFQILVSGHLEIEQDLIISKIISLKNIATSYRYYSEEDSLTSLDGSVALLKKEIINGIITQDVLDIIQKVCTNREKTSFYKLEVINSIYWPQDLRVSNCKDWCEKVINTNLDKGEPSYWFSIPFKEFTNPFLAKRKHYKDLYQTTSDPSFFALQNAFKLTINALYGCIATPFFPIGNVVVGNCITAFGRCEIWKVSKALGGFMSITDGTIYQPSQVFFHAKPPNSKLRKSGMYKFSSFYKMKKHRYLKMDSLGGEDWDEFYKTFDPKNLNVDKLNLLANKHVKDFWQEYNLDVKTTLEHKIDNIAIKGCFWGKAHYGLKVFNKKTNTFEKTQYWCRGHREYSNKVRDPLYNFFDNILNENWKIPTTLKYQTTGLLKVREWRQKKKKDPLYSLFPGDSKPVKDHELTFNYNHLPILISKQFLSRNRVKGYTPPINTNIKDMVNRFLNKVIKENHKFVP